MTIIESNPLVPHGFHVLWRGGRPVWVGRIGAPIEDAEFDKITVNPADYERIKAQTSQ
jgi:hypothetical protein